MSSLPITNERLLMGDLALERGMLCLAFTHSDHPSVREALASLREREFLGTAHRAIYRAITEILKTGERPDLNLVRARIEPQMLPALVDVVNEFPRPDLAQTYANELRALTGARQAIRACRRAADSLNDDPTNLQHLQDLRDQIDKISSSSTAEPTIDDLYEADIRYGQELRARVKQGGLVGVPTGFQGLDAVFGGWQVGLHIIAGARSMGKSSMATTCLIAATSAGKRVRFISLDMMPFFVQIRVASHIWRVPLVVYATGRQDDEQQALLERTQARLLAAGVYFDSRSRDVGSVIRNALASASQWDLLILDHLQAVRPSSKTRSVYERVTALAYGLKALALETGKPVIALCQVPKRAIGEGEKEDGEPTVRPPSLNDLKGSGDIADAALTVTFPYRPHAGAYGGSVDPKARLIVGKNQNGPCGEIVVRWNARLAKFEELAEGGNEDDR